MGRICEIHFDGTYNRLLELDKAKNMFKATKGEICPTDLLSQVLYVFADVGTTDKLDKEDDCKVGDYESMRKWMSCR